MKSILLLFACSVFITTGAQKLSFTTRLNMNTAAGEQLGKFKNAYGMGIGVEMAVKKASPLKWVVNADAATNGIQSMPYEFEFRNVYTKTKIEYNSNVFELTSGLRYVFNEGNKWKVYTGVGMGMLRYSTGYIIEDPEDQDGCRALEAEKIQADHSFIGKMEGGIRYTSNWSIGAFRNILFDAGVSYKRGTRAEYMRLDKKHHHAEGSVYSVKFQSSDNEIHEHAIGNIYNTYVNQLGFHIGLIFPVGF